MRRMKNQRAPLLVAIVGGSGAGKTWLARKLQAALGDDAARISLDDFYRDRSHLSETRRAKINFDHPRAIDWTSLENVLEDLLAGNSARVPRYNFKTHCREKSEAIFEPKPIVLFDGLWLLRPRQLRELFDFRIFIECPAENRFRRRLTRDLRSRGRTRDSVREQFQRSVEPMHERFVEPQKRWADVVLDANFGGREINDLTEQLKSIRGRNGFRDISFFPAVSRF
ncbi:MAG TPA: uridine kinase [Verrucomicrobiae bacterium]|jgi:uridine kinase|nr:uridine kinase [Verrucomicrobiae bacterium]